MEETLERYRYRVVIVDDEPMAVRAIGRVIERNCPAYQVVDTAENGQEALDLVRRVSPDLVLTDIAMPVMNGLEFAKQVRREQPEVNFVVISGYQDYEYMHTVRDKSQIALFFLGNLYEKNRLPYLLFHTGEDQTILGYVLDMYAEQEQMGECMDPYSDKIVCALLTVFFNQLNRRYSHAVESAAPVGERAEYWDEMLDYIMMHYREVSLKELADTFHFSVPYCSKVVRQITGSSFSDLVTGIRLQQGENMLSHTQMNIADISEEIGYKNPETFIRAFRRVYRLSPSQYRKAQQHSSL